jgi:hypothetical protein
VPFTVLVAGVELAAGAVLAAGTALAAGVELAAGAVLAAGTVLAAGAAPAAGCGASFTDNLGSSAVGSTLSSGGAVSSTKMATRRLALRPSGRAFG